jgi:integrase
VLEQHFRPLLTRAGLPAIRFHGLRHTAATLLLGAGINELVISQMLGHADISITLGVYGHVTSDMQAQATAAMERLLGRGRRGLPSTLPSAGQ